MGKNNTSEREQRLPARPGAGGRYDLTVPANQRKLEIVTELATVADEAGLPMVELVVAFVLEHLAVSAAIIGPRTMGTGYRGADLDPEWVQVYAGTTPRCLTDCVTVSTWLTPSPFVPMRTRPELWRS